MMAKEQAKIENPSGTGRGESAIEKPPRADLVYVSIKDIEVKDNVRSGMDENLLFQLAGSMKSVGLLEPVIVCKAGGGKFTMIAGHRRLKAALQNGDDLIEAKVYDTLNGKIIARMQLIENLQRVKPNHVDLARQYGKSRDAGMTIAEIAAEINVSDDHIRKHLDLLRLADPVAKLVASGRLPVKQAELIARVGDPKKQISLVERATFLQWNPLNKTWQSREESIDAASDYVQPMEELRSSIGYIMQGLAACGWPMDEKFAGKRACTNCPDNTATYADQPALFAGINPRGSAKKGHCTNEACYKAKVAAQDEVREIRRVEAARKLATKVAKAKAAGLDLCEGCGRVAVRTVASEETFKEYFGQKLCPKCFGKAVKRAESGGGGGETWQQREKRVKALKKKFPWNAEQKFAKALHDYGMDLFDAIGKSLEVFAPPNAEGVILRAYFVAEGTCWCEPKDFELMPSQADLIGGGQFPPKALAMIWGKMESSRESKPGIDHHDGKVENVPLPVDRIRYINSLEALAKHWEVKDLPERPTTAGIARDEIIKVILKGKKPEAIAAIAACEDTEPLEYLLLPKAVNNIPKIAVWRVKAIVARVEQLKGKAEPDPTPSPKDSADPSQGATDPDPEKNSWTIIHGKKAEALKAIADSTDLKALKMFIGMGSVLKGDWRRAAVRKRIEELEATVPE